MGQNLLFEDLLNCGKLADRTPAAAVSCNNILAPNLTYVLNTIQHTFPNIMPIMNSRNRNEIMPVRVCSSVSLQS
jgi:hypothetical protein